MEDCEGIAGGQTCGGDGVQAVTIDKGGDVEVARTELGKLAIQKVLKAVAKGEHANDCTHTDHDAEHRERCAQLIVEEGMEGDTKRLNGVHMRLSSSFAIH